MPKYSKEDKLKVIKFYKSGYGCKSIANITNIPQGTIKNWIFKFNNDFSSERKIRKRSYSAEFKQKVIETRWKDKLSFKETAIKFELDNPALIAQWQRIYLEEGLSGLLPKRKGRPSMKITSITQSKHTRKTKSDAERIKELEAENTRLKYELSFYDDFMREMREINQPKKIVKKKHKSSPSKN